MKFKLLYICFLSLFVIHSKAQTYAASNFTLVGHLDPETNLNQYGNKYSGCWGWYQASKNKEYAIACSSSGTFWVDISSPATPTVSSFRAGKQGCTWREVKTYLNYCYVISDDPGTNSFQIFDMQYLPDSVHKVYDSQLLFKRGHTLWVDGNKLYVAATTSGSSTFSSMDVYSLATPASPTLIRRLSQDYPLINYVHDMFVRNDTIYASCGYQGLYIYKLTSANTFTQLGSLTSYPSSGYNHSSALTPDGQTLVFTDEIPVGMPIKVADVTNLSNIQVLATTNQFPQTTPHNPFIVNNQYCFVSSYQDGLQLFDISNPASPFLAGYFDTYPAAGGNNNTWPSNNDYEGQWGAYPYFPSKTIFALDESNGIFLLKTALYENQPVSAGFATGAQTLCVGATANFSNTSSGATSYTWSYTGGTAIGTGTTNLSLAFNTAGIFSITLLASNATNSASSTQTILISPNTLNGAITFTNADCNTCTNGAASVTVSGGIAPYTYTWLPSGVHTTSVQNLAPACYTAQLKDAIGCTSETIACVSFFTGLSAAFSENNTVHIYPNPAQSVINIESAVSFDFCLYNKIGQVVICMKNNFQKATVSLQDIPKGIYFVEIISGSSKTNQKIIIN
ncbi:hypothetical protein CNR22_17570 [Sphingobacteriaceae bacterium]|nr:hypothetical protein CNR22_17570 [Sphingobacteriaceae bacterium]